MKILLLIGIFFILLILWGNRTGLRLRIELRKLNGKNIGVWYQPAKNSAIYYSFGEVLKVDTVFLVLNAPLGIIWLPIKRIYWFIELIRSEKDQLNEDEKNLDVSKIWAESG